MAVAEVKYRHRVVAAAGLEAVESKEEFRKWLVPATTFSIVLRCLRPTISNLGRRRNRQTVALERAVHALTRLRLRLRGARFLPGRLLVEATGQKQRREHNKGQ